MSHWVLVSTFRRPRRGKETLTSSLPRVQVVCCWFRGLQMQLIGFCCWYSSEIIIWKKTENGWCLFGSSFLVLWIPQSKPPRAFEWLNPDGKFRPIVTIFVGWKQDKISYIAHLGVFDLSLDEWELHFKELHTQTIKTHTNTALPLPVAPELYIDMKTFSHIWSSLHTSTSLLRTRHI